MHTGLVRKHFPLFVLSSVHRNCQGAESPTAWSVELAYFFRPMEECMFYPLFNGILQPYQQKKINTVL